VGFRLIILSLNFLFALHPKKLAAFRIMGVPPRAPRVCHFTSNPNLKLQIQDVHCIIHDCFARSSSLYTQS